MRCPDVRDGQPRDEERAELMAVRTLYRFGEQEDGEVCAVDGMIWCKG